MNLQGNPIGQARVCAGHHAQHSGHLAGSDLPHAILQYNVAALVHTAKGVKTKPQVSGMDQGSAFTRTDSSVHPYFKHNGNLVVL